MSVENDVRVYLAAQLTDEPTIKLQGLPPSPDDAIAVIGSGGPPPVLASGPTVVMRMVTFQILVRGAKDEDEALETLMQSVHTELQALGTVTMNGTVYDKVNAMSEPFPLPVDRNERPQWACNYEAWA